MDDLEYNGVLFQVIARCPLVFDDGLRMDMERLLTVVEGFE